MGSLGPRGVRRPRSAPAGSAPADDPWVRRLRARGGRRSPGVARSVSSAATRATGIAAAARLARPREPAKGGSLRSPARWPRRCHSPPSGPIEALAPRTWLATLGGLSGGADVVADPAPPGAPGSCMNLPREPSTVPMAGCGHRPFGNLMATGCVHVVTQRSRRCHPRWWPISWGRLGVELHGGDGSNGSIGA
jgi:hypothetical protein